MPRSIYVFDTSALVFKYVPHPTNKRVGTRISDLLAESARAKGQIDLQVPNLCMAECSSTFAKFCFEKRLFGKNNELSAYQNLTSALLQDVMVDRILHSYELKRPHFKDIEDIFSHDYALGTPRGMSQHLSSNDALIISMASYLRSDSATVTIVTADSRMAEVCNSDRSRFPRAVNVIDQDIV